MDAIATHIAKANGKLAADFSSRDLFSRATKRASALTPALFLVHSRLGASTAPIAMPEPGMETVSTAKSHEGLQGVYRHVSRETKPDDLFGLRSAAGRKRQGSVLWYFPA